MLDSTNYSNTCIPFNFYLSHTQSHVHSIPTLFYQIHGAVLSAREILKNGQSNDTLQFRQEHNFIFTSKSKPQLTTTKETVQFNFLF